MPKFIFLLFLSFGFLASCSHDPYDSFQSVQVGDDKQNVLEKAGSPTRSRFRNGQDVWTYKIYKDGNYNFQDVVFADQKVKEIKPAAEVRDQEIKDKESHIEEQLKTTPKSRILEKGKLEKNKKDISLEEEMPKAKKSDFVPVE